MTLQSAAVFLGTNMLRNLVLSVEAFAAFEGGIPSLVLAAEQRHAVLTGAIAKSLTSERFVSETACLAGILHDLGRLVLARRSGKPTPAMNTDQRAASKSQGAAGGASEAAHAGVCAWMLSTWGLPYSVVEAVAYHHVPGSVPHSRLDTLGLVHIADAFAAEQTGTPGHPLDTAYLERVGVTDEKVGEWRARAKTIAGEVIAAIA